MDERLRFVSRLLDGEAMTDVCREFGISRKTGYKIYQRYQKLGLEALSACDNLFNHKLPRPTRRSDDEQSH